MAFVALLFALIPASVTAAGPTQQPKTRPAIYEKLGFNLNVPLTSARQILPVEGAVELCDIYKFGDLAFSVKVSKTPTDTLTATAIEQALQAHVAASAKAGESRRWEIDLPGGDLFKGVSGPLPPGEVSPEAAYARKAFGGKPLWRSLCMAALGDDSSPIVTLGVTGPVGRAAEIENLDKFFAFGLARKGTAPPPPPPPAVAPGKASVPVLRPVKLNKGDIELVGSVVSIDAENKSLNMIVESVRMPQTGYIELEPPRDKLVNYKKPLPDGMDVKSRISVIGFNTGVGNPITADSIALRK